MNYIYFFGRGVKKITTVDGKILGNKGAQLANLSRIGLPVPTGFTISARLCGDFLTGNAKVLGPFEHEFTEAIRTLEEISGKRFGDPRNPLLVSVRSGSVVSMPGMMDTILNVGLNDDTVEGMARLYGNRRFAFDCYRRLISMFAGTVFGANKEVFARQLDDMKAAKKVKFDHELGEGDLERLLSGFKDAFKRECGRAFPQDVNEQIRLARDAVFKSWNNKRAVDYRRIYKLPHDAGTACNIQMMVFGNLDKDSGTGVGFTRNVATGEKKMYGEYLDCAQGEDVVAGIRTPYSFDELKSKLPRLYKELYTIARKLEREFKDVQDFEFTVESGTLYLLQTRDAKRSGIAAIRIAVDMVDEGLIDKGIAVRRVTKDHLESILHPIFDAAAKAKLKPVARGLSASPGAASGIAVFTPEAAAAMALKTSVVLVRPETNPDDIMGMKLAAGILTARGGYTSHAAVVARGMGKPAVVGCSQIVFDGGRAFIRAEGKEVELKENSEISIDGGTGEVFIGRIPTTSILCGKDKSSSVMRKYYDKFMGYVDSFRRITVKANADIPDDLKVALDLGAEGVGLCRTEHMFFEKERITEIRKAILADNPEVRKAAIEKVYSYQVSDFMKLFKVIGDKPLTIRTIDPPLHEFLPNEDEIRHMKDPREREKWSRLSSELSEVNPMMGLRGCRLTLMHEDILRMQVRAIFTAAFKVKKSRKLDPKPRIMIPIVSTVNEMKWHREIIDSIYREFKGRFMLKLDYEVGTMVEIPRAALIIDKLAEFIDFFSFGTNDLTQMTYGFSRDDINKFLPAYLEKGVLSHDPFVELDTDGVGQLMKIAVSKGKGLTKGICGEHGGNYESVLFCNDIGLDYVSASPYRIPIAKLACAHYTLNKKKTD